MELKIFSHLAGAILTFGIINPTISQTLNKDLPKDSASSSKEVAYPYPFVAAGRVNEINSRAIRDFMKRYDYMPREKWTKVINGYVAFFEKDEIKFKVSYNIKGYWMSTMRTYAEKYLPSSIRHPVKSAYYDFNIYLVREIECDERPLTYFIYLRAAEDEMSFTNIMYSNGEMLEVEPYNGKWRRKNF